MTKLPCVCFSPVGSGSVCNPATSGIPRSPVPVLGLFIFQIFQHGLTVPEPDLISEVSSVKHL